ncbi:alpha/beta fold hydrolase [Streptomyces sp. NPDC050560]|uniref:alpha/beta fold hydrolase n=1 Tax=Streptomyces sp. NPDC050560 TaxID=3365630 RepID=UPI003789691C
MELGLPGRLRARPRRVVALLAVLLVLVGGGSWAAVAAGGEPAVHRADRVLDTGGARIDTSYFTAGAAGRRPAVLLAHGFGGSKDSVRGEAEELARDGYAVLTWSARGFGRSTGRIGLNAPDAEVADVSALVDWLARRPEVRLDAAGDPRVGVTGASYGGAVALLAAAHDHRVDAIAPEMTYWNLADALFPDGVFKKLWAGIFFTTGSTGPVGTPGTGTPETGTGQRPDAPGGGAGDGAGGSDGTSDTGGGDGAGGKDVAGEAGGGLACGRFQAELCAMYERVAVSGTPDAAARRTLEERSPSAVGDRIKVPTLIAQGQTDSLFPLGQADAMARRIKANGAPVAVDWLSGGHDGGDLETGRMTGRIADWFGRYLKGDTSAGTGPAFRVSRSGGLDSTNGTARLRGATADRYPGLDDAPHAVKLGGAAQTFANPPGGGPPAISAVPGLGANAQLSGSLGLGLSLDYPGQFAAFDSAPLTRGMRVTGSPAVTVRLRSTADDAVVFAKVYDVAPDGSQTLPAQLVTPLRVDGARGGRDVRVTLPAVDHEYARGHRLRVVLSTTDLGYATPAAPATYTASPKGALTVPTAPGVTTGATPVPSWVWWVPLAAVVLALVLVLTGRRRAATPAPDSEGADVPLAIEGLSKRYAGSADRYAVRDLSFRVEQGQVLGLLGPNGAGKTTTLRMLMGLITPDEGEIRIFGHAVRPGAPVLSRVGAFVEGAGFLPHLSGRANLDLYWAATGRPAGDAHVDEALRIAGLGDALERAVRTYSQGMRQRLAIAQAMLGLPDLLILDEPTNGLDPPQIREMREVMIRYAAAGRTVIVSSHLLAEVEQTCTHLVVMDRGRLVRTGPVGDIVGSGGTLLVGLTEPVDDPLLDDIARLPGVAAALRVPEGLLVRLEPDDDPGPAAARLLAALVKLGVPVESLGPQQRLEDAFLTLIGGSA